MHKYLIGTLFEQQQQQKKTNLQNIKARDPNGNVRWKGAFTGGFQAGYKNTCGSKVGWEPAQFVSSIAKRAEKVQTNILSYMDQEDLGRQNIAQNISVKNDFQIGNKNSFNIQIKQTIGEKILNKIKRQQAYNNAPQNIEDLHKLLQKYAKQQKNQELTNSNPYNFKDLDGHYSVGAQRIQFYQDDFITNYQQFFRKVIRERTKQQTQEEIAKRRQQNKIYFDFTKPLEEQPQYLKEIQEIQQISQPRKRRKNILNEQSLKHLFKMSTKIKQFSQVSVIEKIPQNYDPYHRLKNLQSKQKQKMQVYSTKEQQKRYKINSIEKRSDLLGQKRLSDKFKTSTIITNSFIKSNQNNQAENIKKVFDDDKKNQRYIDYKLQREGKKISEQLDYLGWEEAEKEKQQFQKMYKLQTSKQSHLPKLVESVLLKKEGRQIQIRRSIHTWRPQKLLCKRFNVLPPHS